MTSVIKNNSPTTDSDAIEIGRLIGELIDHRKLIIAVTSAFTVLAVLYALLATPIYQANALIQVEQKQGNAILNSLTQMLPDAQPQSAPEIALLQSRMILGKTVTDLDLQTVVKQKYFPIIGRGLARALGESNGKISITRLYLPGSDDADAPKVILTVIDNEKYEITGDDFTVHGKVGELLEDKNISILVNEIKAEPGTKFNVIYRS
ncbi:Wzz/FepE/Etk N-terminal domain-containing protein, partial [Escherichia coli]